MEVRPSTLNFLSFFLNTKLTSYTETFVNDSVKVFNITKVVYITREEEDTIDGGGRHQVGEGICETTSVSLDVF